MVHHANRGLMTSDADTIVAEATPPGRGGVAIVRISGSRVKEIAQTLLGCLPAPRQAQLFTFKDHHQQAIDQGLAIYFEQPHSFTGEDILELHGHGGPIVVNLLIQHILTLGARLAKPGEFSERAFLNNKLDLAQAEAVADLIQAGSEQAARSALRSLQGAFSTEISQLTESVIELRMYIEAAIDFAEEEIDFLSDQKLQEKFTQALSQLATIKKNAAQGSLLREGINMVIAGKPNVGKSTLLNLLSGKELAIVSAYPGTTRDLLREQIHLDGIPLHMIDTAGLRTTQDPIEQEGIRRAKQEIKNADLILYVVAANEVFTEEEIDPKIPVIIVRNKIDLTQEKPAITHQQGKTVISLSAKHHLGIDLLKETIKAMIGFTGENTNIFSARQRHLDALETATVHLKTAYQQLLENHSTELIAEDLRQAQKALNEITGEFTTEDLLGRIFSSFCIGK